MGKIAQLLPEPGCWSGTWSLMWVLLQIRTVSLGGGKKTTMLFNSCQSGNSYRYVGCAYLLELFVQNEERELRQMAKGDTQLRTHLEGLFQLTILVLFFFRFLLDHLVHSIHLIAFPLSEREKQDIRESSRATKTLRPRLW